VRLVQAILRLAMLVTMVVVEAVEDNTLVLELVEWVVQVEVPVREVAEVLEAITLLAVVVQEVLVVQISMSFLLLLFMQECLVDKAEEAEVEKVMEGEAPRALEVLLLQVSIHS
jgi:hypothetical protein